jgi:F1F0 ATPase subunit 2
MLVSMEVDTKRVNMFVLGAHFAAGIALGALYFGGLWWNTRLFTEGGRLRTMILLMIGRFLLLGAVLTLASLEGAMPLLLMALGIFISRFVITSRIRVL